MTHDIVYIKGDQNVEVKKRDVKIGDILSITCANEHMTARIRALPLLKMPDTGKHRAVISVLKVIECIHQSYPTVEVQNLGTTDFIVTYEEQKKHNQFLQTVKAVVVSMIVFFGSAFSIMAFHNDVNLPNLFSQIYQFVIGNPKKGFSVLELGYSIGLVVGILVFFNHFGGKRFSVDPTPIEVEMRLYENDLQTTLVENYARKGKELDVDQANRTGNFGC